MKHRVFDDEFKKMAVELSRVKNSVKEAALELDIDPSRLSKWPIWCKYEGLGNRV